MLQASKTLTPIYDECKLRAIMYSFCTTLGSTVCCICYFDRSLQTLQNGTYIFKTYDNNEDEE